jgi:hypothetical protein
VVQPEAAWRRLALLQQALDDAPALAHAVRRLSLFDQLVLTIELLEDAEASESEFLDVLPPNVIPFRPR